VYIKVRVKINFLFTSLKLQSNLSTLPIEGKASQTIGTLIQTDICFD